MAENSAHKDCNHYPDCSYLNDVGWCPLICLQYRHKDYVRVVRCKDCKHRTLDFFGGHCCKLHKGLAMVTDESFCSYGERKDNE